jgi:hypothetical protein
MATSKSLPMNIQQLFLWRGARRLGALHPRDLDVDRDTRGSSVGDLHAVLLPEVDPAQLASLWQRCQPFRPNAPVVQRPRGAWIMNERRHARDASGPEVRPSQPPAPVAHEAPAAMEYTVRDENGRVLPFQSISILEVRLIPGREAASLGDLPTAALVRGSIWIVSAFRLAASYANAEAEGAR